MNRDHSPDPPGDLNEPAPEASAAEIAEWATDADRLLPGEDPRTAYATDAVHWVTVFEQLIGFKDTVLKSTRRAIETMEDVAAAEIRESDLRLLEAERRRFVERLAFWTQRAGELEAR